MASSSGPLTSTGEDPGLELESMSLEKFRLWTPIALRTFLRLRGKITEGSFEELVARAFITYEEKIQVNSSAEHAARVNLSDYKAKLRACENQLPDPFSLDDGWLSEEEGRKSWPSLYFLDICEYLQSKTPSELYHRLCNEYKQGKAYRYYSDGLVKAVHYHPIADIASVAFFAGKVRPSMRHSMPDYQVWVAVQKDSANKPGGKIYSAYCTCPAGLHGSCNHVAGVLFRVEFAVRSGLRDTSKTSELCQWVVPSQGNAVPEANMPLADMHWKKAHYFSSDNFGPHNSVRNLAQTFSAMTEKQEKYVEEELQVQDVAARIREVLPNCCFIQMIDGNNTEPFVQKLPPAPMTIAQELCCGEEDFNEKATLFHSKLTLTAEEKVMLEKETTEQSDCDEWHRQRKGRITASNFKRVFTRMKTLSEKPSSSATALLVSLTEKQHAVSVAIKHGKSMEPHAKKAYERQIKKIHKVAKFTQPGLVIDDDAPYLAASPDLYVTCKCHGRGLCEIKCPLIKGDVSVESYKHLHLVSGDQKLNHTSEYYYQIQGQMAVTKLTYCDFFVFPSTNSKPHLERIEFDPDFWSSVKSRLSMFWISHLLPYLLEGPHPEVVSADHTYAQQGIISIPPPPAKRRKTKNPLTKPVLPLVFVCEVCSLDIGAEETLENSSVECTACSCWVHFGCALKHLGRAITESDTVVFAGNWLCERCRNAVL